MVLSSCPKEISDSKRLDIHYNNALISGSKLSPQKIE